MFFIPVTSLLLKALTDGTVCFPVLTPTFLQFSISVPLRHSTCSHPQGSILSPLWRFHIFKIHFHVLNYSKVCDYVWTHTYTMPSLIYTRQGRQTSCVLEQGEETFVNQELHWHQEVSGLLELELVTGGCETPDLIVWELIQVICKNNRCSQALTRLFSAPSEAGPYSKLVSKSDPPASIPRC